MPMIPRIIVSPRHSGMSVSFRKLRESRVGRAGMLAGGVLGGLLALDLIGFVATAYFGTELLQAAQSAGVAELLPR